MKAKRIVSIFAALAMLAGIQSVSLAKTTRENITIYSLDLSNYEVGQTITPDELASDLGINIHIPAEYQEEDYELPSITVAEEEIQQNYNKETKKYLKIAITPKKAMFQLSKGISFPSDIDPDTVKISVLNKVQTNYDGKTRDTLYQEEKAAGNGYSKSRAYKLNYLPQLDDFAQLGLPQRIIVQPRFKHNEDNPSNDGLLLFDGGNEWSTVSHRYSPYNTWLDQHYVLNYSDAGIELESSITDPWNEKTNVGTKTIDSTQLPSYLNYKMNPASVGALADDCEAYLCISDLTITAEQDVLHNTLLTNKTTFFDNVTKDSAAVYPAVFGNNVYQINSNENSWPSTAALNKTELPKTADNVQYQFCDLDAADGAAKLIVARYDVTSDGYKEIKDASITDVTVESGKVVTDAIDLNSISDGMLMQVYLWSADNKLVPVAKYGSAEIGKTGTAIYKLDFENNYEVIDNQMGRFAAVDNSSSSVTLTGETARFGDKSLKLGCKAQSTIEGTGLSRNGFRFETKERDGYTLLGEELKSVAENNSETKPLYRISFYAKAETAEAKLEGQAQCHGLVEGQDTNWNSDWNTYYWKRYRLFSNITVQPGDWQYFVVYTTFPMYNWDNDHLTASLLSHDIYRYDTLNMDVVTDVDQNVYFDNVVIEKLN